MSPEPDTTDPAEAMLARLAGLDLTLAQHVHECAMATTDPHEVAELAKAYTRVSRCVRQSLALHARLKRERERAEREVPPPPLPRDEDRIKKRAAALRAPVHRAIWSEYERCEDPDYALYLISNFDDRLPERMADNAFGLEPFDDHVVQVCADYKVPEATARAWRDLPDPPPEAYLDDDDEDAAQPAPEPAFESSA